MKALPFVLWLVFGCWYTIYPQNPDFQDKDIRSLYPVRVNHKIGFIEISHNNAHYISIDPIYDFIGEVNLPWNTIRKDAALSPYRIFERNKKVGLVDAYLNVILPNKYNRIRPVADNLFAVETDKGFQLIDSTNNVYLDSIIYDDICLVDVSAPVKDYFFFVKDENKWGLRRSQGPELIQPKYVVMQSAGLRGYYKVKTKQSDFRWELIDTTEKRIISR